jgi:hypothetical protein
MDHEIVVLAINHNFALGANILKLDAILVIEETSHKVQLCRPSRGRDVSLQLLPSP